MKAIGTALNSHLASEVTHTAICWKLTRSDQEVMGFTSHDQDITYDTVLYKASSGFTPSDIQNINDLQADNLSVEGMIASDAITKADIHAGLYDEANVEIFIVNYEAIEQGRAILKIGKLAAIRLEGNHFSAEIKGLSDGLKDNIGRIYSPLCRAKLGDAACGVTLSPDFIESGTVTNVTDKRNFSATALTQKSGFFDYGKITFTSGNNNGLSMEVKNFQQGGIIELVLPMAYELITGDSFTIEAGCDKRFTTCITRFNNAINFRGEPHIPGIDALLKTAGTI